MEKKNEQGKEPDSRYWNDILSQNDVISSTECTGMIQTPPLNDEQVDGYMDIFHVPQQKAESAMKANSPAEQEKR